MFQPEFVHGLGCLLDKPMSHSQFVHGIGVLVDKPMPQLQFVHGLEEMVDKMEGGLGTAGQWFGNMEGDFGNKG